MGLSDQMAEREARQRRKSEIVYWQVLRRNDSPQPGDFETLANVSAVLGKTAAQVHGDAEIAKQAVQLEAAAARFDEGCTAIQQTQLEVDRFEDERARTIADLDVKRRELQRKRAEAQRVKDEAELAQPKLASLKKERPLLFETPEE